MKEGVFVYDSETKCQEFNLAESKDVESSESGNAKIAAENDVDSVDCIPCCQKYCHDVWWRVLIHMGFLDWTLDLFNTFTSYNS
jgi:hypothetical protein